MINGKRVQIQPTGFMEKHTGKFMKELWALLISAQKNACGVPQQLLDGKEEQTRKKKEESDMILSEIHKRKEKENRDFEQERVKMMVTGFIFIVCQDKHAVCMDFFVLLSCFLCHSACFCNYLGSYPLPGRLELL